MNFRRFAFVFFLTSCVHRNDPKPELGILYVTCEQQIADLQKSCARIVKQCRAELRECFDE